MKIFLDFDPNPRPVRIAILGSCVTRDAFHNAGSFFEENYTITKTIMRQSISAVLTKKTPVDNPEFHGLNNFETRCLEINLAKNTFEVIATEKPEWILIDLIDERNDLSVALNKGVITRAAGFVSNSRVMEDKGHDFMTIRRGWGGPEIAAKADMKTWLDKIREIVPENRIILHKAYWADMIDGPNGPERIEESRAERSRRNNIILSKLYKKIISLAPEMHVIGVPERYRIIDPNHRWGPEAFHYKREYYDKYLSRLNRIIIPTRWLSDKVVADQFRGSSPENRDTENRDPKNRDPKNAQLANRAERKNSSENSLSAGFKQICRYTTGDPWKEGPGIERHFSLQPVFQDADSDKRSRIESALGGSEEDAQALLLEDRKAIEEGKAQRLKAFDGAALASFLALRGNATGAREIGLRMMNGHGFTRDTETANAWLERARLWESGAAQNQDNANETTKENTVDTL